MIQFLIKRRILGLTAHPAEFGSANGAENMKTQTGMTMTGVVSFAIETGMVLIYRHNLKIGCSSVFQWWTSCGF